MPSYILIKSMLILIIITKIIIIVVMIMTVNHLQTNHFDPAGVKEIADSVTNRWQNLVTR